jgi:hypothetical protein
MGGSTGGATANNEQTITFEDTSEYMYRNSSKATGGFKATIGLVNTNTSLDTAGAEDITRTQQLLLDSDMAELRADLEKLTQCTVDEFCADKTDLKTRAGMSWDRALALYPTYQAELAAQLDDLKAETYSRICLWESQWARTAGSSLNCLVQSMKNKAEVELARRIAGVIAETNMRMKEHETQALAQAFMDNMNARLEPDKIAFSKIGTLWGILRGSTVTDVTDRDYNENKDERRTEITAMGDFYHEVVDWSENDGSYGGERADLVSLAQSAVAGVGP